MRKFYISAILLTMFAIPQAVFAENTATIPATAIRPVQASGADFSKSYKISPENLLYLLLSAINEHNYLIEEIQFKTGSVLFKAYTKEFIASVSAQDGYNSYIKIVPVDNNYNFSPLLIQKLQNYIETNNAAIFQKVL